jgi:GntR family transcriptional repressor for pyruvate dehydrogenase complex
MMYPSRPFGSWRLNVIPHLAHFLEICYCSYMYKRIFAQQDLTLEVATQIKDLIRGEKLKPGDKLPNEMELSRLFGVSRPTVREAVKALLSQNIIEIVRGKGTFVSQMPGIVDDPLGLDFVMNPDLRLSLVEARLLIEPGAARLAAKNADEADVARIERFIDAMSEIVRKKEINMDIELDFHRSIAEATKNPVIIRIVPVIIDAIIKTYRDAPRTSEDHRHASEEHRIIFNAVKAKNPSRAFRAMQHHLEMSYQRTLFRLQGKSVPPSI